MVKSDDVSKSSGYYCEVCECSLKDSVAYLDHINGKKRTVSFKFNCLLFVFDGALDCRY